MSNTPASVPLPVGRLVAIGAIIFAANAAMLVLQLVAGRLLSPYIGSSLETWTSIIGVFLAGIALGNGFGGKLADRYPTPRTLAALLAVGAVAALWMLVFPMILAATGLHKPVPLGARIPLLAAALCLPAGFVLSLLTPLAIKLGLPDVAHTGRVAGLIFALSTLGCLIGNYVTGFYLIPTFTINALVGVSAGTLLALAAVSVAVVRAEPTPLTTLPVGRGEQDLGASPPPPGGEGSVSPSLQGGGEGVGFPDIRRAYLIVFLASFCGMTLELTASRVLALSLGVSLFTWTGIIGVMLAGTALGNFAGGQLADDPRRARARVAAVLTALAVTLAGGVAAVAATYDRDRPVVEHVLGMVPGNWAKYREVSREYGNDPPEEVRMEIRRFQVEELPALLPRFRVTLGLGLVLGDVLGVVLGAAVFRAMTRGPAPPADPRHMLAATLCSAAAATVFLFVAYSVVTNFGLFDTWDPPVRVVGWTFALFFLPMFMLGLVSPQVIRLAVPDVAHAGSVAGRVYAWSTVGAIVGTFAAGYVLLSAVGMYRTILGASLVLVLTSLLVAKVWDNNPLLYLFSIVLGGVTGGFILTARNAGDGTQVESNYYTIKVTRTRQAGVPAEALNLNLDHLLHSVVDPYNPTYLYYTHEHIQVEFMWHARAASPEPKALVIGGGGYTFPRYVMETVAREAPGTRVDVVEIDPKVTQVARDKLGLQDYPGLHAIHMDGRQYVAERAQPGSYDLVIQDAVNDLSVPAHLMTKEYNDAIKAALKPNGVYLLTIIDSVGNGKLWKAAMATLGLTFPAENVVLLTPQSVPEAGTEAADRWAAGRQVMVIYASDKPFDRAAVQAAQPDGLTGPARTAVLPLLPLVVPGGGPAPLAYTVNTALNLEVARRRPVYTTMVPPARLKPFTDPDPGVILTDQFCPIDNLMAEVFRARNKRRRFTIMGAGRSR
jgi:predicted membrane-bound spermidine synthase